MVLNNDDIEKLDHFIKGKATEVEKEYVESLFLHGENNDYLRQTIETDWENMLNDSSQNKIDLDYLLDRIYRSINKNESIKKQRPIQKILNIYSRVAAILVIPIMMASIFMYVHLSSRDEGKSSDSVEASIFAPMGSRVTFNLPDGTKGVLNGGSILSYMLPFDKSRLVKLEGEAWFEVKHDENHPMVISAGNSKVKVLGTSFNLNSYPNENYIEVVLKDGKVEFTGTKGNASTIMQPSERLVFQNGNMSKSNVDPAKYNGWTEGKLIFRSDPMTEVARRIERWYNVKVTIADKSLEKYTFRATFQDDKVEDVIKFLAMTSPINYKIIDRKMLNDGTIQKKEIIMYKRN